MKSLTTLFISSLFVTFIGISFASADSNGKKTEKVLKQLFLVLMVSFILGQLPQA